MSYAQMRRLKLCPIFQVSVSGEKKSETRACSRPRSSFLSQVVGTGGCARACACVPGVHVCGPALICMPVWLTHSAVNSVILGGLAVQGLHWHPTLVLKRKQTQVHKRTLQILRWKNTHRHMLKNTCINTHKRARAKTDTQTHTQQLGFATAPLFNFQLNYIPLLPILNQDPSFPSGRTHIHTVF